MKNCLPLYCILVFSILIVTNLHCFRQNGLEKVKMKYNDIRKIREENTQDKSTNSPITVDVRISKAPKINENVKLFFTITSAFDAPNSIAEIELPEGAILVNGNLNWKGDLIKNIPVQLSSTIKFIKEGNWTIKTFAKQIFDEENWWGDVDYIYLNVTKKAGQFGFSKDEDRIKASQKAKKIIE